TQRHSDVIYQVLHELVTWLVPDPQDNECLDGVPFHRIGFADYRCLRYCLVRDKSTLYFCSSDIVAGYDDDIVSTAEHHDISVFTFDGEASRRINPLDGLPVFPVPLVIFIDGPEHRRPGCSYRKKASGARRHGLPLL